MSKDPAFLFYSKDFYEGTRMMLPEERACYIDLMIYQHQNGIIPNDLRRIMMYCSGVDETTLKATLEAKFKQCDKGWYNEKLLGLTEERKEYSSKQSNNGKVGQFFKLAKSELSPNEYKELKDFIYQKFGKNELIKLINSNKTLKATLKGMLKHLANAIANEDAIGNVNEELEGGVGEGKETFKSDYDLELEELQAEIKNQFSWKEMLVRNFKEVDSNFNLDKLEHYLEIFFKTLAGDGEEEKNLKDFKKHFNRWLKIQIEKSLKNQGNDRSSKTNAEIYQSAMESETGRNFRFK